MFRIKKQVVVKQKTVYIEVEQKKRFANLIVVITGASGSIGSAISRRLAKEGATVILCGRNIEALTAIQNELIVDNKSIDVVSLDVTDADSIECAMRKIFEKYGRIDILINNAGYSARSDKKLLHQQSIENIDNLLDTNLRGTMLTSREVVQYMKESEQGRILNISSIVGLQGKEKHAEYAAAKSGLFGLMKSQAIELGAYGITVNCVSPGLVPRDDASAEKLRRFGSMNRLNEICTPEDIAHTVAFLCSKEARFITGQNISVDGGRSLGLYGD